MKKTLLKPIAGILTLMLIMTACGQTEEAEPATDAATADAATTEAATAETANSEDMITLSWFDANAYATEEMDALLNAYGQENNIKFEIEHVPNDSNTVMRTKINSDEIPDIWANLAGPENELYAEYSYDWANDEVISKFNEDAIAESKYGDMVIGLPWSYEAYSLIYNKTLFEQAGITEMPTTLSALDTMCADLQAKGITPFANGYKDTWILKHIGSHFIASEGGTPQEIADSINAGKSFGDFKNIDNLFALLDLTMKYGQEKPLEANWEAIETSLVNDQAAMIHMGNWAEATLLKMKPDVQVGFLPMPISEDPADAKLMVSTSWLWKVNKDSEHLEEAKAAVEYFLTSDAGIDYNINTYGVIPTVKTDVPVSGMLASQSSELIDAGQTMAWPQKAWPVGFDVEFGTILQSYVAGDVTKEEAIQKMDESWANLAN